MSILLDKNIINTFIFFFFDFFFFFIILQNYKKKLSDYYDLKNKFETNKKKGRLTQCPNGSKKEEIIFIENNDGSLGAICSTWEILIIPPKYTSIDKLEKIYNQEMNIISEELKLLRNKILNNKIKDKSDNESFEKKKIIINKLIDNLKLIEEFKENINNLFDKD
jgi:hypothetical protein